MSQEDKETQLKRKLKEVQQNQEEEKAKKLAAQLKLPYVNLKITPVNEQDINFIPENKAKEANLVLIKKSAKTLALGVKNPSDEKTKEFIERLKSKGYSCKIFVVSRQSLKKAWQAYDSSHKYTHTNLQDDLVIASSELQGSQESLQTVDDLEKKIQQIPTSELLKNVLAGAIKMNASDVHLEPTKKDIRLRYRIDGILQNVATFPSDQYRFLLSRIKTLSSLLLNVHDRSQDGSFSVKIKEGEKTKRNIDLRVSVLPSNYGETVVMRLLGLSVEKLNLEELGIRPASLLEVFKKEISRPNGMILNTGPTGSGKTTTLYACLNFINKPSIKVITIENPIEYKLEGITQTEIKPEEGYTFAESLKAIVRQDPDILMLGEIRDKETTKTSLDFALTGHIVFSTLHTNQATGAIPRLIEMKAKPASLASALNLVIAQRLVRKLCPNCKEEYQPDESKKEIIEKIVDSTPNLEGLEKPKQIDKLYRPKGCEKCHGLGYQGRIGIFEFLTVSPEIKDLIKKNAASFELQKKARESGMMTFFQDAILKITEGVTSIEEAERIIGPLETILNSQ